MSGNTKGIRNDVLRRAARRAVAAGWTLEVTGSGHRKLTSPTGAVVVFSATSATTGRATPNTLAKLRRAGLDV